MKQAALAFGAMTLSTGALAGNLAFTSFEEPPIFPGVLYVDTGDPLKDHQLFNHANEPWVEYTDPVNELGFLAFYVNTRDDVGLTDGDFVGVTDFTGDVGQYTDGLQGYEMSDADGMMRVVFDPVDLSRAVNPAVSVDYFIPDTGWETTEGQFDRLRIWVETDVGNFDIIDTTGNDIDDLGIEGRWITGFVKLSGATTATLMAELDSNAATEALYLDNIRFFEDGGQQTETVLAESVVSINRGIEVSGDISDTNGSEDVDYCWQPDAIAATIVAPINFEVQGTATNRSASEIRFSIEVAATDPGVVQRIELFDFATNSYRIATNFPNIPTDDTVFTVVVTQNPSDLIAANGAVRARLSYLRPAGVPPFWNACIDHIYWEIDP